MGQVAITINGNNYQIACDEGQEERLTRLGAYVDERTAELVKSVGDVGDVRLMVMASLMVTDKLFDAMAETETLRAQAAKAAKEKISEKSDEGLALIVEAVAERIEDGRVLRGSLQHISLGPISILRELALPGPWSRYSGAHLH